MNKAELKIVPNKCNPSLRGTRKPKPRRGSFKVCSGSELAATTIGEYRTFASNCARSGYRCSSILTARYAGMVSTVTGAMPMRPSLSPKRIVTFSARRAGKVSSPAGNDKVKPLGRRLVVAVAGFWYRVNDRSIAAVKLP